MAVGIRAELSGIKENPYIQTTSAPANLDQIAEKIFKTNSELVGLDWLTSSAKRDFDKRVAWATILPAAVVMLMVATAVYAGDRHDPVVRLGYKVGSRRFRQTKIRTQKPDAQSTIEGILRDMDYTEAKRSGALRCIHTEIGKRLRNWSIDELPQVLDVLRGNMSIVGPRPPTRDEFEGQIVNNPERAGFVRGLEKGVNFGATGFGQVFLRGEPLQTRLTWEEVYMDCASIDSDRRLLLATPLAVASRRGAR